MNEKEQLIKLWMDVFGDAREYIERFFKLFDDNSDNDNKIFYKSVNGNIISALYVIRYNTVVEDIEYKAYYFYALATDENYRQQGIMKELIEQAINYCDENDGLITFLIPAEKSLFSYYKKFGFEKEFISREMVVAEYIYKLKCQESFELIKDLYNKQMDILQKKKNYIYPDFNQFAFWVNENILENNFQQRTIDDYSHIGLIRFGNKAKNLNINPEKIISGPLLM